MPEQLKNYFNAAKTYFNTLSLPKKIGLGAVGALIVVAAVVSTISFRQDPYETLYNDLSAESSKAVSAKLSELNIPHQLSEDQTSVSVPKSLIHSARMELAKEGLPGDDVVGFEAFDNFSFGTSNYVQRIQYIRAVQGELTRSIQRIAAVKRARVHISVPPKKTFMEDQDPPKASVVVEMHRGQELSKAEVKGITHIVASAVEGLSANQVTIVDTGGKFLHRPEDAEDGEQSMALLEKQKTIEKSYEKRIEELLAPVVGPGKVIAKVTAELDSSRVNLTEESYDGENAVPMSVVTSDEVNTGSRPNPLGIPGSRANLPGSEVDNPPVPMANLNNERNTKTTQYAVPKKVQSVAKPGGSIKRLTVAVVVDGNYQTTEEGKDPQFLPRTEEELNRFKSIVSNAVGFDESRRDSITVSSLPFRGIEVAPEDVPELFNWKEFLPQAIRNGLIALVVLLFFFMVVRPYLKWATLSDLEKEVIAMPKTIAEVEIAQKDLGVQELTEAASILNVTEPLEKQEEQELARKVNDLLTATPEKGYRIIEEWLEEGAEEPKAIAA